jgi:hypothetical protein
VQSHPSVAGNLRRVHAQHMGDAPASDIASRSLTIGLGTPVFYCRTLPRRFPANQIPALYFRALLNEEAPEVKLMLAGS